MFILVRGGLGNQMFQAAFAISTAERHQSVAHFLDLTSNARVARAWALSCFGIRAAQVTAWQRASILAKVYLSHKLKSAGFDRLMKLTIEHKEYGSPPDSPLRPSIISGYWQGPQFFARHDKKIRETFQFPEVPTHWRMRAQDADRPTVAIHVRRGDYVSDAVAAQHHLVCGPDWYRRAWAHMQACVPNAQALVFSDDPQWVRDELKLPGQVHVFDSDPERPDWCDMAEMSRCQHFIISNSSYSWWAAYLGETAQSRVMAPHHWFRGRETRSLQICPSRWELLP